MVGPVRQLDARRPRTTPKMARLNRTQAKEPLDSGRSADGSGVQTGPTRTPVAFSGTPPPKDTDPSSPVVQSSNAWPQGLPFAKKFLSKIGVVIIEASPKSGRPTARPSNTLGCRLAELWSILAPQAGLLFPGLRRQPATVRLIRPPPCFAPGRSPPQGSSQHRSTRAGTRRMFRLDWEQRQTLPAPAQEPFAFRDVPSLFINTLPFWGTLPLVGHPPTSLLVSGEPHPLLFLSSPKEIVSDQGHRLLGRRQLGGRDGLPASVYVLCPANRQSRALMNDMRPLSSRRDRCPCPFCRRG